MTSALLVVALVVLVLLLVFVDMCRSPFAWLLHVCCDTVGGVLRVIAWVLAALAESLTGSSG